MTSKASDGVVSPIPILPLSLSTNRTVLLTVKFPFATTFPEASMFVKDCAPKYVEPVTFKLPLNVTFPTTSRVELGIVAPIPTLPAKYNSSSPASILKRLAVEGLL